MYERFSQILMSPDAGSGDASVNFGEHFQNEASEDVKNLKNELLVECGKYLGESDLNDINRAYEIAYYYHAVTTENKPGKRYRGTKDKYDKLQEYMVHPANVALTLAQTGIDKETVLAAILHDTIEDTAIEESQIAEFGEQVLKTVKTVTKITGILTKAEDQAKILAKKLTLSKLILAFKEDPRAILVKLADRLDNMRTLEGLSEERRREFAKETLDNFVPMARIANLDDWADQMSDMAAFELYPNEAKIAQEIIDVKYKDEFMSFLKSELENETTRVSVGKPHVYELIRQAEDKSISVVDPKSWNLRIICRTHESFEFANQYFEARTYGLGEITESKYGEKRYNFGLFNSSVAVNVYDWRSHMQAKASLADLFRVYIPADTHFMQESLGLLRSFAKIKLAAPQNRLASTLRRFQQAGMRSERQNLALATETLEWMREGNPISVYTSAGEIIPLNEGNTAWDFAFFISPDLGLKARGVFINDSNVLEPMNTVLNNDDSVRIDAEDYWTVNLDTLDSVSGETRKDQVSRKLKKILDVSDNKCHQIRRLVKKYSFESLTEMLDEMQIDSGSELKGIRDDILKMLDEPIPEEARKTGFKKLFELELLADEIRKSGEIAGRKKLKQIYKNRFYEMYEKKYSGKPAEKRENPLVDLNRGFMKMPLEFRVKYGILKKRDRIKSAKFKSFLIDCGIGKIKNAQMEEYVEAVFNYEEDLPKKMYIVPDRHGTLATMVNISSFFANIVDIKTLPNLPEAENNQVGLEIRFETETDTEKNMLFEIWDTLVDLMNNPEKLKNILDSYYYDMSLPENISLRPFLAVLEGFGHTAGEIKTKRIENLNRRLRIIPLEPAKNDTHLSQNQLYDIYNFLKAKHLG